MGAVVAPLFLLLLLLLQGGTRGASAPPNPHAEESSDPPHATTTPRSGSPPAAKVVLGLDTADERLNGLVTFLNVTTRTGNEERRLMKTSEGGIRHPRPIKGYNPGLPLYASDAVFGPLLARVDAYLASLGAASEPCRKALVCRLGADPPAAAPYSVVILGALRELQTLGRPSSFNPASFQLFKYHWAAQQRSSTCGQRFPTCERPVDLPAAVLQRWRTLAHTFSGLQPSRPAPIRP